MLRLVSLALLAIVAARPVAAAQSESAAGLSTPPVRGTRYVPGPTGSSTAALPPPPTVGSEDPLPDPVLSTRRSEAIPGSADAEAETRLDAIDFHLSSLGARRQSGVGGGVVTMLLGSAYIGLGVYANRNDEPSIARYFYITGIANLLKAGVGFGLQPNTERAYTRFSAINEDETLPADERLRQGESIFRSIARRRMASRFVQGGIDLTVTAISLPYLLGNDGFRKDDAFDWIVSVSAIISTVDAVTSMVQRTEEERRWRMYQALVRRRAEQDPTIGASVPRLRLGDVVATPLPAGGYAAASFIF